MSTSEISEIQTYYSYRAEMFGEFHFHQTTRERGKEEELGVSSGGGGWRPRYLICWGLRSPTD